MHEHLPEMSSQGSDLEHVLWLWPWGPFWGSRADLAGLGRVVARLGARTTKCGPSPSPERRAGGAEKTNQTPASGTEVAALGHPRYQVQRNKPSQNKETWPTLEP